MDELTVGQRINLIHDEIKELFPEAASVKIIVTAEGIEVYPRYRTNLKGYTMRNINGEWVGQLEKSTFKAGVRWYGLPARKV